MKIISIIREYRKDEGRTPITPLQVKYLKSKFSNIQILVQPSNIRCFSDKDYENNGAIIEEDVSKSDLILGIKEVEPSLLIESKSYMFFSHTSKLQSDNSAAAQGTPGMDKKKLLKEILRKKIKLIDYENIRDNLSRRYLGFGRFAGIVGCYNSLNLYLSITGKEQMPRAQELYSYEKLIDNIKRHDFGTARIIITGDGRVAKGSLELLKFTNIKKVSLDEYIQNKNSFATYCNVPTSSYVAHNEGKVFDLQHFISYPKMYSSILSKYLINSSILISSHYWDPKSPKLFEKKDISRYSKLKVIGDITCDINGSIPTTLRSTTIKDPYFYLDRNTFKEIKKSKDSLAIMAIDNLPSELPRESSAEFGEAIINEVLPFFINQDDGRLHKATITSNGELLSNYIYLKEYINN